MNDKTHYRKAFDSPYLSSADIVEPTVLTIASVTLESDKSKKTKDSFNTAYFVEKQIRQGEPLKPMILNASNSRTMKDLTGSHFIDDWAGTQVMVYVDANVRFGKDTVEGLRLMQAPQKEELTPNHPNWKRAVESYKKTQTLEKVLQKMNVSAANQTLIKEQASA